MLDPINCWKNWKNERKLFLRKATLKGDNNSMPITVFGELVHQLK